MEAFGKNCMPFFSNRFPLWEPSVTMSAKNGASSWTSSKSLKVLHAKKLIALFSVLLQNGHPGGQIWLWESATAEPGHVSVRQPQTAGGGATARPGLPDQQPVGHLLDHHILSVTCTGFMCCSPTGCETSVTLCFVLFLFWFGFFGGKKN